MYLVSQIVVLSLKDIVLLLKFRQESFELLGGEKFEISELLF